MNRRDAAARWLWAHDGLPPKLFDVGVLCPHRENDRAPSSKALAEMRELYRTKADALLAVLDANGQA